MTRTGYAWEMSNTPASDPNIVNTKALEGMVRAFDRVINTRYGLGSVEPTADPLAGSKIRQLEMQVVKTLMGRRPHAVALHRPSFWHTFPLVKTIVRFRDSIRLRRYNREWIKSNIH